MHFSASTDKRGIETDLPQADEHAHIGQELKLALEIRTAVGEFAWQRLGIGRNTPHRRADVQSVSNSSARYKAANKKSPELSPVNNTPHGTVYTIRMHVINLPAIHTALHRSAALAAS